MGFHARQEPIYNNDSSRKLTARQIAGVTRIVADQDMNIDDIKRLTGRIPLDENARTPKASVEFSVRGTPRDKEQMKADS